MSAFSVFGNPIKHSKSPQVYSIFAEQYGIAQVYTRILAFWMNFDSLLKDFFYLGGVGANITMPFKERAFYLCDEVTSRASVAGSVNTIKQKNGILFGDNTDGIGLLTDLKRLQWLSNINDNDNINDNRNKGKKIKVLLLGAGGAARGVIVPLLSIGCQVVVMNRTVARAQSLVNQYKDFGELSCIDLGNQTISSNIYTVLGYDIIINATSSGWVNDRNPVFPVEIVLGSSCYDMSYKLEKGERLFTPFILWCQKNGALRYSDGLGMLVSQAAHSFLFWHDFFPCIDSVLRKIK